jgi:sugar phosphate isomerase/epimerase
MPVYVSTSCLANGSNVFDVLETYAKAGLRNIELGSPHKYISNLSPAKFARYGFNLIAHHYFPPPHEPLIVNLASYDAVILKRSKDQIKRSIAFCHSLGIKLFTFHAGFRADPTEKLEFIGQPVTPYETAFDTFVESVNEINRYAKGKGVRIAIENNVLSDYNVVEGQNPFLLLCKAEEFERVWERIPSANVGILLDLGHLKVTSHWLKFDRYEFIDRVEDRVFAIHVHENNGRMDEHRELGETSWCFEVTSRKYFTNLPVVLESSGLIIDQIGQQVSLIEKILGSEWE